MASHVAVSKQGIGRRVRGAFAAPKDRAYAAENCVNSLRLALQYARWAGAPLTLYRVKLALASARGAVRHAEGRVSR